jgi:hypothetical protein
VGRTGTVALSDRLARPAPLARTEAMGEAFRCPVYWGFQGVWGSCLPAWYVARTLFASCNSARETGWAMVLRSVTVGWPPPRGGGLSEAEVKRAAGLGKDSLGCLQLLGVAAGELADGVTRLADPGGAHHPGTC